MGETLSKDTEAVTLEVAVIGKTGSGKSTFINTFAPLSGPEAAETGVVETTHNILPYDRVRTREWPISEAEEVTVKATGIKFFVRVWDFPGYESPEFPEEKYLHILKLMEFDFYLLLSSDRVRDFERKIHNFLVRQGKLYFYIRTHYDWDVTNTERDHPGISESEIKQKLIDEIKNKLSFEPEIYFINAKHRDQYDFPKLERELVQYIHMSKTSSKRFGPAQTRKSSCSLQ